MLVRECHEASCPPSARRAGIWPEVAGWRDLPKKLAAGPGNLDSGGARDGLRSHAGEAGRIR